MQSEQEEIGWDQWFKGRFFKMWGEIYDIDLWTTEHHLCYKSPQNWATTMIEEFIRFILYTWTVRNKIEHGTMIPMIIDWLRLKLN
jgi:hypothetical protein